MTPVLVVSLLLGLTAPSASPMPAPDPTANDCWVQPLKVTLPELALMGAINEQLRSSYCLRNPGASYLRHLERPIKVGETRLGELHLFGETFRYGFDVVWQPGYLIHPDNIYAVPALDLPPAWTRTMDTLTYPALAIGGAAMMTYVIMQLVHH
jgi:hypothetical protein